MNGNTLLDAACLIRADGQAFAAASPFPWCSLPACLTADAFERLTREFPSLELFERQQGIHPANILRPHDRYYLAFSDDDRDQGAAGIARAVDLAPSWRQLIGELNGPVYQGFIRRLFGCRRVRTRFAWHLGHAASEVSPHLDAPKKLGTHLIYFNTQADWDPGWGGATLILGGPRGVPSHPDFDDFAIRRAAPFLDNHSLLFRNGPIAWHGVERMTPPPGHYRRLFTVVFEYPRTTHLVRTGWSWLHGLLGRPERNG